MFVLCAGVASAPMRDLPKPVYQDRQQQGSINARPGQSVIIMSAGAG